MEVSTVPFQQYAPFFKPEELDTLGGVRDVETMKEQAMRSLGGGVRIGGEQTFSSQAA